MKKLRITGKGVVFSGYSAENASALYPGVCMTPAGRFIVTFRSASHREATRGQRVLACISDDDCMSWSAPREFFPTPPGVEGKQGEFFTMYVTPLSKKEYFASILWVDTSDPTRPYYNPDTHGIIDHRIFFSRSMDCGQSWSDPWILEGLPHSRPTALNSPTLLLPDGRLCCQFEVHKNHDDPGPIFFESVVMFSADGGQSWGDYTITGKGAEGSVYFWDQRINRIGDDLLGLYWTYDDSSAKYLNIHAASSSASTSKPVGLHWSAQYDTGVPGQPSQPVQLGDGSIAMAYVDRSSEPAIKVRRSFDGGKTWPVDSEVLVHNTSYEKQEKTKRNLDDMWKEMYQFSVGFPVATATLNGGMLVCFYAGKDTDHTSIHWAKMELQM
ncbi:MAG TPA: exo-alpha-sialidase [Clostridiales bacterium]|jgi:hypothetical protein|nr:exo-alpha-sialidase [Clostridiales bacterium]